MYCRNCGIDIEDNMKFCPKCGIRVVIDKSSQEKPSQEKSYYYVSAQSRTTAMLLCSLGFIGFAGFHRFYVGNWRSGVVYFLSSGLFFLGTFYDLYQLYNGAFKDMDGYPLFSSAMMKENYRYRELTFPNHYKTMLLCMSLFFILNIFNTIIHLRNTQQQNAQQPKVQQQEETSHHDATSIPNDSIKKTSCKPYICRSQKIMMLAHGMPESKTPQTNGSRGASRFRTARSPMVLKTRGLI